MELNSQIARSDAGISFPAWLSPAERDGLCDFVSRIQDVPWLAIWLFGSRARCEGHSESDIDIALEVGGSDPRPVRSRWNQIVMTAAYEAGLGSERPAIEAMLTCGVDEPFSLLYRVRDDAILLLKR